MAKSNKQIFIETVEMAFEAYPTDLPQEAIDYFESFKTKNETKVEKKPLSNLAKRIYICLCNHSGEYLGAREIAEELDENSRSVSSTMRKLVNEDYVERKEEGKVITYAAIEGRQV